MIDIDFTDYNIKINELAKLGADYEQIIINLFDSLKNSCVDWQDSQSILFEQCIFFDKKEIYLYLEIINNRKEVIEYIYDQYNKFGKKIFVNLQHKDKILNMINDVCEKINKIIFKIDNVDSDETHVKLEFIKQNIKKIMKYMLNYQKKMHNFYSELEDIELRINKKINEIELFEISDFLLLKYEGSIKRTYGFIAKENLINDISKIHIYSEFEYKCLKDIYSCYCYFYEVYNSDNKGVFFDKILNISKNTNDILAKRSEYCKILSDVIDNYESTSASVSAIFDETQ